MVRSRALVFGIVMLGTLLLNASAAPPLGGAPAPQALRINIQGEPATLDPAKIDNRLAGTIAKQLFEGLTRLDNNGNAIPGVAERWSVSADGKTYTFRGAGTRRSPRRGSWTR